VPEETILAWSEIQLISGKIVLMRMLKPKANTLNIVVMCLSVTVNL